MVQGLGAPCSYAAEMPESRQDHILCSDQRIRVGQAALPETSLSTVLQSAGAKKGHTSTCQQLFHPEQLIAVKECVMADPVLAVGDGAQARTYQHFLHSEQQVAD